MYTPNSLPVIVLGSRSIGRGAASAPLLEHMWRTLDLPDGLLGATCFPHYLPSLDTLYHRTSTNLLPNLLVNGIGNFESQNEEHRKDMPIFIASCCFKRLWMLGFMGLFMLSTELSAKHGARLLKLILEIILEPSKSLCESLLHKWRFKIGWCYGTQSIYLQIMLSELYDTIRANGGIQVFVYEVKSDSYYSLNKSTTKRKGARTGVAEMISTFQC